MSSKIILPCPFRRGRIWRTGPEKPKASHTILHVCALVMTVFGKSVMTFGLYERKYVRGFDSRLSITRGFRGQRNLVSTFRFD